MEALLFGIDVFFMLILVFGVVRREKKKNPAPNLGFFAYFDAEINQRERKRGRNRA